MVALGGTILALAVSTAAVAVTVTPLSPADGASVQVIPPPGFSNGPLPLRWSISFEECPAMSPKSSRAELRLANGPPGFPSGAGGGPFLGDGTFEGPVMLFPELVPVVHEWRVTWACGATLGFPGLQGASATLTFTLQPRAAAPPGTPPAPAPVPVPAKAVKSPCPARFARAALPLARTFAPLAAQIQRQSRKPKLLKPLLSRAQRLATRTAGTFDLVKLARASTWKRVRPSSSSWEPESSAWVRETVVACPAPVLKLRAGQIKQMPAFASDLRRLSAFESVMLKMTDEKYATDAEFRSQVDLITGLDAANGGLTYGELDSGRRINVAKQVMSSSGAIKVLLQLVRNAGRSATGVTFGK